MPHTYILLNDEQRLALAVENQVGVDDIPLEAEVEFTIKFEGQYNPASQTDPEALADASVDVTGVLMDGEFTWDSIKLPVTNAAIAEVYNDYWNYFNSSS